MIEPDNTKLIITLAGNGGKFPEECLTTSGR